MKYKTLLLLVMICSITISYSQNAKQKQITGFAITAAQKGQSGWKEVRFMDLTTGEELKSIYQSSQEVELLNARTGKPVVKKDISKSLQPVKKIVNLDQELDRKDGINTVQAYTLDANKNLQPISGDIKIKLEQKIKQEINNNINNNVNVNVNKNVVIIRKEIRGSLEVQTDKPFATNSAACAYDKKHERLYYTPMGINQLRYIDLKSKTPKIYYFEDESFGVVSGMGDAPNQITRMVIASDGDGYALSNNGDHLIRFTTGKKPVITDLGALTDDPANGNFSVHSRNGYGGDMIADAQGNLYLITANRNVFKISIENKTAAYQGTIKGLPGGFTTNGAMVEGGSKVIVASSQSTLGYFKFDLTTMQAEKISTQESVYNASDLANGVLAFDKKKKEKKQPEVKEPVIQENEVVISERAKEDPTEEVVQRGNVSVYPNPVTNGFVKLSFEDQPAGRYQVQLLDISGKLVSTKDVTISNKVQIEEFRLPELITKGNYLLKVVSDVNRVSIVNKITVQ